MSKIKCYNEVGLPLDRRLYIHAIEEVEESTTEYVSMDEFTDRVEKIYESLFKEKWSECFD